jgi:hypothetical protein
MCKDQRSHRVVKLILDLLLKADQVVMNRRNKILRSNKSSNRYIVLRFMLLRKFDPPPTPTPWHGKAFGALQMENEWSSAEE